MIKLNHRSLLDGIFEACGVPEELFRPICSAVDKLDKVCCSSCVWCGCSWRDLADAMQLPWAEVADEMVKKGLDAAVAESIGAIVQLKGSPSDMMDKLKTLPTFAEPNKSVAFGMDELKTLFSYCEALGTIEKVCMALVLPRSLWCRSLSTCLWHVVSTTTRV